MTELPPNPNSSLTVPGKPQNDSTRLFSPVSIGFLGLIVAIVLWGTAYKLSLYHPHPSALSRTQVAKLWLESRTAVATPVRKTKSSHRTDVYALAATGATPVRLAALPGAPDEPGRRPVLTPSFSVGSRSPPSF